MSRHVKVSLDKVWCCSRCPGSPAVQYPSFPVTLPSCLFQSPQLSGDPVLSIAAESITHLFSQIHLKMICPLKNKWQTEDGNTWTKHLVYSYQMGNNKNHYTCSVNIFLLSIQCKPQHEIGLTTVLYCSCTCVSKSHLFLFSETVSMLEQCSSQ